MREIKFRAWDKDSEIMVYSDLRNKNDWTCDYFFQQNDKGNIICYWDCDYDDSFGEPTTDSGELYNLMQYTGIKDKHGTEIYEVDIINTYHEDYDINELTYVSWCEDAYWGVYETPNKLLGLLRSFGCGKYEVIGNIYQNPELLEQ